MTASASEEVGQVAELSLAIPDLLASVHRSAADIHWTPLPGTDLEVTADAVRVDGVRVPVSPRTAQRMADLLTATDREGHAVLLLTPELVDLVYCLARCRPPPMVLEPDHDPSSYASAIEHTRRIDEWLRPRGFTPGDLVAPVGKDWVLTEGLTPTRAFNYGWHLPDGPDQLLWPQDSLDEHDYAHTLRLVRVPPGAWVPGLREVVRQPGVT